MGLKFPAPLINVILCRRETFLMWVGGVRRPGLAEAPNNPPPPFRRGGERCHPRGPASSEVTRAQQAHWELRSLECSWGREVLSTPQDFPSTGTLPAGLALCATLPVTLWVSQGAPQTTRPVHPSGVQSWAGGSCRSPDPQTPSAATW